MVECVKELFVLILLYLHLYLYIYLYLSFYLLYNCTLAFATDEERS